ncbi:MAG: restriction endonuclease subunit S [Dialister sp.]
MRKITTLGEVATYINGRAFKPSEWETSGLPIIRIQNLNDPTAKYNYSNTKYEDKYLVKKGDLLFSWSASLGTHIWKNSDAWLNQHIFRIIPNENICKGYLYHFLCKVTAELYAKSHGTGMVHITKKPFMATPIPVPSLPEQERIVTRIEELFSELDKAVETLQTTKQQLAVYRQAVLKEAFEAGIPGYNAKSDMLSIEELLTTARKGMATGPFGTMIKKHEHQKSGIPMLGIENIGEGKYIDGNKIFVTTEKAEELKSFALHEGDIIISRSGTVGEICAVPQRAEGALLSTNLMRVSLNHDVIRSDYFIFLFQSKGIVLDQVKELCKGSTRIFLNQTILKQIQFPVPSLNKQMEIVHKIESRLSVCESIEQTVDTALAQADAMRQSILKQAFEGGYV